MLSRSISHSSSLSSSASFAPLSFASLLCSARRAFATRSAHHGNSPSFRKGSKGPKRRSNGGVSSNSGSVVDLFLSEAASIFGLKDSCNNGSGGNSHENHHGQRSDGIHHVPDASIVYSDAVRPFLEKKKEPAAGHAPLHFPSRERRLLENLSLTRALDKRDNNDGEQSDCSRSGDSGWSAGRAKSSSQVGTNSFMVSDGCWSSLRENSNNNNHDQNQNFASSSSSVAPESKRPVQQPQQVIVKPATVAASPSPPPRPPRAPPTPPSPRTTLASQSAPPSATSTADHTINSQSQHHQQQQHHNSSSRFQPHQRRILRLSHALVPELSGIAASSPSFLSSQHWLSILDTPSRRRVRFMIRNALLTSTKRQSAVLNSSTGIHGLMGQKAAAAASSSVSASPSPTTTAAATIIRAASTPPRILVTGPRCSGKTATMSLLVNDLRREGHLVVYIRSRALPYHGFQLDDFAKMPCDVIFTMIRSEMLRVAKLFVFPQQVAWPLFDEVERVYAMMVQGKAARDATVTGWSSLLSSSSSSSSFSSSSSQHQQQQSFVSTASLVALVKVLQRDLVLMCDRVRAATGVQTLREERQMIKQQQQQQEEEEKQSKSQIIPGLVIVVDDIEGIESLAHLHGGDTLESLCRLLFSELTAFTVLVRNRGSTLSSPSSSSSSSSSSSFLSPFERVFTKHHLAGGLTGLKFELLELECDEMTPEEAMQIFSPPSSSPTAAPTVGAEHTATNNNSNNAANPTTAALSSSSSLSSFPPRYLFEWIQSATSGYPDAYHIMVDAYIHGVGKHIVANSSSSSSSSPSLSAAEDLKERVQALQAVVVAKLRNRFSSDLLVFYSSLSDSYRRAYERNVLLHLDEAKKNRKKEETVGGEGGEEQKQKQNDLTSRAWPSISLRIIDERYMVLNRRGELRSTCHPLVRECAMDVIRSLSLDASITSTQTNGAPAPTAQVATTTTTTATTADHHHRAAEGGKEQEQAASKLQAAKKSGVSALSKQQKQILLSVLASMKKEAKATEDALLMKGQHQQQHHPQPNGRESNEQPAARQATAAPKRDAERAIVVAPLRHISKQRSRLQTKLRQLQDKNVLRKQEECAEMLWRKYQAQKLSERGGSSLEDNSNNNNNNNNNKSSGTSSVDLKTVSGDVTFRVRRRSGRVVTGDASDFVNNVGLRMMHEQHERQVSAVGGYGASFVYNECRHHPAHITDATCHFIHFRTPNEEREEEELAAAAAAATTAAGGTNRVNLRSKDAIVADEPSQVRELAETLKQSSSLPLAAAAAVDASRKKLQEEQHQQQQQQQSDQRQPASDRPSLGALAVQSPFESPADARRFHRRVAALSNTVLLTRAAFHNNSGSSSRYYNHHHHHQRLSPFGFQSIAEIPTNTRAALAAISRQFVGAILDRGCTTSANQAATILRVLPWGSRNSSSENSSMRMDALASICDSQSLRRLVRSHPVHVKKVMQEVAMISCVAVSGATSAGGTGGSENGSARFSNTHEIECVKQCYKRTLAPMMRELAYECGLTSTPARSSTGGYTTTANTSSCPPSSADRDRASLSSSSSSPSTSYDRMEQFVVLESLCEIVAVIGGSFDPQCSAQREVAKDTEVHEICRRVADEKKKCMLSPAAGDRARIFQTHEQQQQQQQPNSTRPRKEAERTTAIATTVAAAAQPQSLEELVKLLDDDYYVPTASSLPASGEDAFNDAQRFDETEHE